MHSSEILSRLFHFGTVIGLLEAKWEIHRARGNERDHRSTVSRTRLGEFEEEITMKVTVLSIIFALGLLLPLFWIVGTVTSIIYYCLHREKETAALDTRQAVAFNPQLGLTMADGGDAIDKEKEELPRSPGEDGKPIRNERRK
jgi:hypothetical protein